MDHRVAVERDILESASDLDNRYDTKSIVLQLPSLVTLLIAIAHLYYAADLLIVMRRYHLTAPCSCSHLYEDRNEADAVECWSRPTKRRER